MKIVDKIDSAVGATLAVALYNDSVALNNNAVAPNDTFILNDDIFARNNGTQIFRITRRPQTRATARVAPTPSHAPILPTTPFIKTLHQ